MKKTILKIGKALNKTEQKSINGGGRPGGVCRYRCEGVQAFAIDEEACLSQDKPCYINQAIQCGGNGNGATGWC